MRLRTDEREKWQGKRDKSVPPYFPLIKVTGKNKLVRRGSRGKKKYVGELNRPYIV